MVSINVSKLNRFFIVGLVLISMMMTAASAATWDQQTSALTGNLRAIDCISSTVCWIAGQSSTAEKLQKTTDGGTTWSLQPFTSVENIADIDFADGSVGYMFSSSTSNFFKTTDGGNTWTTFLLQMQSVGQAMDFVDSNNGYFLARNGELARTNNGGVTALYPRGQGSSIFGTTVFHNDIDFVDPFMGWVVGSSGNIAKTTDAGSSWQSQASGVVTSLNAVYFLDANRGWAVGTNGVVLRTQDGGTTWTWTSLNSGLSDNLLDVHFVDPSIGYVVGVGEIGRQILRTTDGGNTWSSELISPNTLTRLHFSTGFFPDLIPGWAIGSTGAIYKRSGGGSPSAVCGNDIREGTEECDDGNVVNGDGCSSTCTFEPSCGNGIIDAGEQCDDGSIFSGDGCSATCTVETGWACTGSPSNCVLACGNGVIDAGETCDDGNRIDNDGCSSSCDVELCGNNVLDLGEVCDDGNRQGADGCSSDCLSTEVCGNNYRDITEQCDDGMQCASNGVSCTSSADCFGAIGDTCAARGGDGCTSYCFSEGSSMLNPSQSTYFYELKIDNVGSVPVGFNLVGSDFGITVPVGGEVLITFPRNFYGETPTVRLFPGTYTLSQRSCVVEDIPRVCGGGGTVSQNCGFLIDGAGSFTGQFISDEVSFNIDSSLEINGDSVGNAMLICARDGVITPTVSAKANLIAVRKHGDQTVAVLPEQWTVRDATGAVVSSDTMPAPLSSVFYGTGSSTGTVEDNNCILLSRNPGTLSLTINGEVITKPFSPGERLVFEVEETVPEPPLLDADGDGVADNLDRCPDSVLDRVRLKRNQYAQNTEFGAFEFGPHNLQSLAYSMETTKGCTCKQIVGILGAEKGYIRKGRLVKGCSPSIMERFTGVSAEPDKRLLEKRRSLIGRAFFGEEGSASEAWVGMLGVAVIIGAILAWLKFRK